MKKALFITSLLALALTACDNKDAVDGQPTAEQVAPTTNSITAPATEEKAPVKDDKSTQLIPTQSKNQVAIGTEPAPPEENSLD